MSQLLKCIKCRDFGWELFFNQPQTSILQYLHPDNTAANQLSARHIVYQPCTCDFGREKIYEKSQN